MERLQALRGATTLDDDSRAQVIDRTGALLSEMMKRNDIAGEDIVSIIFTATDDIHAEFPAAAARSIGLSTVPLLCARELDVVDGVTRCIRVLMHVYTETSRDSLRHVYLERARPLRTDLPQ